MTTTFSGNSNETIIYNYCRTSLGLNVAGACAVLSNIKEESQFDYNSSSSDGGYGICQWTGSRITRLRSYCDDNNLDSDTLGGQLSYLNYELQNYYTSVWSTLRSTPNSQQGAYDSAYYMCYNFEIPDKKEYKSDIRGTSAKEEFWPIYSSDDLNYEDKGSKIVNEAKKYIGKSYSTNNNPTEEFTSGGFVQYVYRNSIERDLPDSPLYQYLETKSREYKIFSQLCAGDIIFLTDGVKSENSIIMSGIFVGDKNSFIGSLGSKVGTFSLESEDYKDKFFSATRVVSDYETTGSGNSSSVALGSVDAVTGLANSLTLSSVVYYDKAINKSLQELDKSGNSYNSITDLKNGGSFKFYSTLDKSESITANWSSPGSILGRSVPILGYNSTGPRTISVSIELYAGTPYGPNALINTKDSVGSLHNDVSFLKSLEYPDYETSVVETPPLVFVSLGKTLRLRGVVTNVTVVHMSPFDEQNRSLHVKIDLSITQVSDDPPDYLDIRSQNKKSY